MGNVNELSIESAINNYQLNDAITAVGSVRLQDDIIAYIVDIVRATRESPSIETGASPRAAAAIAAAARAHAALAGRDFVIPDDVKILALPALRHRIILSPAAEIEGKTADETLETLIEQITAPR
jgi:MoxR-like ATPase